MPGALGVSVGASGVVGLDDACHFCRAGCITKTGLRIGQECPQQQRLLPVCLDGQELEANFRPPALIIFPVEGAPAGDDDHTSSETLRSAQGASIDAGQSRNEGKTSTPHGFGGKLSFRQRILCVAVVPTIALIGSVLNPFKNLTC